MKSIYEIIRANVEKASERIQRIADKKIAAEEKRHHARRCEIDDERDRELAKARAALALIPKEENPILMSDAEAEQLEEELGDPPVVDDEPNMVQGPPMALPDRIEDVLPEDHPMRQPYKPSERLTGRRG